jgi:DNA-binding beta-propeller fold protein YncE
MPGQPFDVVTTRDGRWSFVSLPDRIGVVSLRAFAPKLVRAIPLPAPFDHGLHGLTLTHDGHYLLATAGSGAVVIDARRAVRDRRTAGRAVLGRLQSPPQRFDAGAGAIAALTSRDGHYAFVARSRTWGIAVFDLRSALRSRLRTSGFFGTIPLQLGPMSMTMSPDGRWLYATSLASATSNGAAARVGGSLSVIDLRRAVTSPDRSVLRTVAAGCEPVRVTTAPDGKLVWVAALGSHAVLGFSASRLRRDPRRALVASVSVGRAPVGVLAVSRGRRLLVADSGSSTDGGPGPGVSVIDSAAALRGRKAVLGSIPAGGYPRELAAVPGHQTALLTNYATKELEAVDLRRLP